MYAYHLARLIIMRASFSVSRIAAILESCNSEQSGLKLCFLNRIELKKYFTVLNLYLCTTFQLRSLLCLETSVFSISELWRCMT